LPRHAPRATPFPYTTLFRSVFAQKDRQIPAMAAVIIVLFLFWVFVAHALFALFMGLRAFGPASDMASLFLEGNGPLMLAVGTLRSEEHTSELQSRENLVCRL